tara:strand:+ start:211 stop:1941 length:1731 start_codon:yes stop_codon:yes gene_type:complete
MENILKLTSQQSLFNSKNNLVDLIIPGNSGVYNLSETYVSINCSTGGLVLDTTTATDGLAQAGGLAIADAVADVRLGLKHHATQGSIYDNCAVPIECLVKNCSMTSASRGKVEDIRNSSTLRGTMKAYTQDIEDVETAALGGFAPQAKTNPWGSGRFAQLVGVGDTPSSYSSHEIRIKLSDLFNIAVSDAWDTAVYGDTRIHLELALDRVLLQQVLVGGATLWNRYYHNQTAGTQTYPVNIKYKTAQTVTAADAATPASYDTITMAAPYESLDDSPFHTNQGVKVTTTVGGAGNSTPAQYPLNASIKWAVIKSIAWDKITKLITLNFGTDSAVLTHGTIAAGPMTFDMDVEGLDVTPATLVPENVTYQSIELTAVRQPDNVVAPKQIQYTQFQTQSDQWANTTELNRSYFLPAQTTNAFIVLPSNHAQGGYPSDILGCARLSSYRFSINGHQVTNRPIPFMPQAQIQDGTLDQKNDHGSSLHYSLISETMMNSGRPFISLNESVFDQSIPLSTDVMVTNGVYGWERMESTPMKACYMICLPIPTSNLPTQLTIELNGQFYDSSGQMSIYSEVTSVI